jgi:N-acyl-D-amino-acid deacylase
MRSFIVILSLAALALALGVAARQTSFDLLIVNARVMDGSGNPWVRADLGVRAGRVAAVGHLAGSQAARVIDARDRLVTPGFIDVHSHAGESLTRPELRQARPIVAQGVTTIVINPDGGGPVDLAAQRTALERAGFGPNVAQLVGHASVRSAVLGDAARPPSADELARMRDFVRRAMREGAFGLSSGLYYLPGSHARTEEVIALAAAAGEYGGVYTSHIRDESDYNVGVVAAVQEVVRIADEGHVTGIVSHMKALGPDSWGLSASMIERIEQARARGVSVFADQYPYEASSTALRAALLPGVDPRGAGPVAAGLHPGGLSDQFATVRENIRRRGGPASIVIAFFKPDPSLEGKSLAEIAAATGRAPEQAALDIIEKGGASIVSFNMSEADIERIMRQPWTMTSSDGGLLAPGAGRPHPRNNGAFARKLARYVRERGTIGLEFAIRSMTSLPATVFGLKDRGVIREGAWADLAIFDPAAVRDTATYADPHLIAEGMDYVLINGQIVVDGGQFGSALPGRVLRLTSTH